jgi:heme exporter protein A
MITPLSVEGLAIARGDRTVLKSLSFTVAGGEVLHVQGRNGIGKTSLLETLCGLRTPQDGSIGNRPEPAQQHWLGHKNALNAALSPLENLGFWCRLNGSPGARLEPALQRVGLKVQRHRPCGSLSTGQRRRAALARLILAPRPWWFLDEPLAGLDFAGLDLLAELLHEHLRGGGAAILTSHQPLPPDLPGLRVLSLER